MNIRLRLTLQFSAIVSSILLIFSLSLYFSFSKYREHEFYKRLTEKGLSTARMLVSSGQINETILHLINKNTINAPYSVYIYDSNQKLIYNSDGFSKKINITGPMISEIGKKGAVHYEIDDFELIGSIYSFLNKRYYVIAYSYDRYGWDKLRFLGLIIGAGFLFSVINTFIAAYFYAGQSLKPISKVITEVDHIGAANLYSRVDEGNGNDEIAVLAKTFNNMLERLETSFKMQHNFVSNASHELRTPLTAITGQIEVALMKERTNEEYERILFSILEDIKNLGNLSNGLLDLATVSFDFSVTKFSEIRIDDILWQARAEVIKMDEENKVFISFGEINDDEEGMILKGNENLLKTAFINLIGNACKYSVDKQAFITIYSKHTELEIQIKDNGIGIPEDELKMIFQPFYRASNASITKGHGLGLPLADKIILLHHGKILIESSQRSGSTFNVHFNKEAIAYAEEA